MPFKLRVGKRAGRYDLSGDLYVVPVYLLDGNVLQCTLGTESTGKECMDYICQRLELRQNIFFGLRYKCNGTLYRWVELDKPLRKQLDKTGRDGRLFFGVMFHTPHAHSLTDPVARFYYFLQMRADVLDGGLLVSPEKAILLASYSLQIDLGDHDEAKPTVATLREKPVLPRHMTQSWQVLEDLIKQVLVGYNGLRGLPASQAELLYISEAQQCDGYGVEYFSGRDEDGCRVFLGYCMEGIIVKRLQGPPVKYKWEEMVSIVAHRRTFLVNCAELAQAHFQMEDADTAKYAAYVCGLHLQFFRNFCCNEDGNSAAPVDAPAKFGEISMGSLRISQHHSPDGVACQCALAAPVQSWLSQRVLAAGSTSTLSLNPPSARPVSVHEFNSTRTAHPGMQYLASLEQFLSTRGRQRAPALSKSQSSPDLVVARGAVEQHVLDSRSVEGLDWRRDSESEEELCAFQRYNPKLCQRQRDTTAHHHRLLVNGSSSEEALNAPALKHEFDCIPKRRVSAGLSTAQRVENGAFNRDPNVLPYEDTRVTLRPSKDNPHGYINASLVGMSVGKDTLSFIAAQGPSRETMVHFWRMVWEYGCRVIVMLSGCMEWEREECYPYWPRDYTKVTVGEYQLTLHNCSRSSTRQASAILLKHTGTGRRRLVYHMQYLDWTRESVPASLDDFVCFVDEVRSVKVHVANQADGGSSWPLLVHCGTGAGRTGLYILVETAIHASQRNREWNTSVALTALRQQRMMLVQTFPQYSFVHSCLAEYTRKFRLI